MQAYKRNKLGIDLKIDNYKDSECYKVELAKEEYVHLLDEIKQLKRKIDELNSEIREQNKDYIDQLNDQQRRANRIFSEKRQELMEVISILEEQIDNDKEYKKLVMQQKNDSCVDRGVSKKSSGYFFLDAIEWREKISKNEKVVTWKYVVQTPFLATYPRLTVQSAVLNMLAEKILPDCDCIYFDHYDDVDDVLELPVQQYFNFDKKYEEDAYVYDWKMRANFVRGYWEIELFITRELKIPAKYQLHYCQKKRSDELKNNS